MPLRRSQNCWGMRMSESIAIIYDGDCLFCTRALRALAWVDVRRAMQLYDSHASSLIAARFPMLAGADFDQAMFAVTPRGDVFRGYFAFKVILRRLPLAWPLLPLFYLPGVDRIGPRAYAWVARNRRRFGCTTDVCVPPGPPPGDSPRSR